MNIVYLLSAIGSITALIIWLGKLIITKTFDAGVERYKSSLTKDVERYKTELSKVILEHQVRFSKLHDERAAVIKMIFINVVELEGALINSTTVAQGAEYIYDTERDNDAKNKIIELINLFDQNRIYFSDDTVIKFEAIIKESWDIVAQMAKVRRDGVQVENYVKTHMPIPENYLRYDDLWSKAFDRATRDFKILKEDLANEFRGLLGIF